MLVCAQIKLYVSKVHTYCVALAYKDLSEKIGCHDQQHPEGSFASHLASPAVKC